MSEFKESKFVSPELVKMFEALAKSIIRPLLTIGFTLGKQVDDKNVQYKMQILPNPSLKDVTQFDEGIVRVLRELLREYEEKS